MITVKESSQELFKENEQLRKRLEEAETTIEAIKRGEVDAVVVYGPPGEQIYTLEGADKPYRLLVEAMEQPVATINSQGHVLYCNPCFADLFKVPHEKAVGQSMEKFLADADKPAWAKVLQQAGTQAAEWRVRLCRGDGDSFRASVRLNALPFGPGICLLITDLTEREQLQELMRTQESLYAQTRKANERIRTQQGQYEEMKKAQEVMREAQERKDEFIALLAHELRNPLAPIRNVIEILKLQNPSDPDLVWCRDILDRQASQLAQLIEDLYDVSRLSRSNLELRAERVDLISVLRLARETSEPLIRGRRHELSVSLPAEPIWIRGDPVRLAQVFSNLLNNAARYTDEGGRIRLSVERIDHEVVVSVRDTGMGIVPEMLPRVFDTFTQGERAQERGQGGLGIGLSLAKGIVEMHGGHIEAKSEGVGQGSEFVVRLPMLEDDSAACE
jgi:PAS domain S-box-containing protein